MIDFPLSEQQHIRALLRRIFRDAHHHLPPERTHELADFAGFALHNGASLRDDFDFNRMETALEAICIAAEEIGLRGQALTAFFLRALCRTEALRIEAARRFGSDMAATLAAFARVEALEAKTEAMKSDNFRNLLVSQAGDMRVVLLLIADSVNLMRRVKDSSNAAGRHRLATEAACLYAPLAHKLGLYQLKSELEDLSLKYLEHDAYYMIKDNLNATKKSRDAYIERFTAPIRRMLDAEGLKYHMKGRTKSIHSIWQKMKKQQCGFSGVYDLFAIRIILDAPPSQEKAQCWKVFSLITAEYESNLKRLRDWLTVPKSNGYESLHITVRGPEDKWVEVQIRTERMDEIAEHGLAAHWRYKGVKQSGGGVDSWLADIRSALETGNEKLLSESLSEGKRSADIYVFTPKGDLYRLPAGSTVLDFAYHIHTAVGNHCVGGRMNGKAVPIRQQLESGATVEILTSNAQTPKLEWLGFVASGHAKAKIRSAVRELDAKDGLIARELLERKLKNKKIEWDETVINILVKRAGFKEAGEFYRAIAGERVDVADIIDLYQEIARHGTGQGERTPTRSAEEFNFGREKGKESVGGDSDVLVIDRNLKGLDFAMAHCCNPVYGDDVFGFVTRGGGIKIHRTGCPNANALRERFPYRIVKARWAGKGGSTYPITLHIVGHDDLGIVNNITSIIAKEEKIMLRSISIDSNDGLFSGVLTVLVEDTSHLTALMKKLRTVKGVKAVSRI